MTPSNSTPAYPAGTAASYSSVSMDTDENEIVRTKAESLCAAVQYGSFEEVKNLLSENEGNIQVIFDAIQRSNPERDTILHIASLRESNTEETSDTEETGDTEEIKIIKALINAGAKVDAVNQKGQTPFNQVVEYETTSDEVLINNNALKNSYDGVEIALYYLENHYDEVIPLISERFQLRQCLTWVLVESELECDSRVEIAQKLVDKGADVNEIDIEKNLLITKLLDRYSNRIYEAIWLLKQDGINLNPLNTDQIKFLAFEICSFWDEKLGDQGDIQAVLDKLISFGLDSDELQFLLIAAAQQNNKEVFLAILNFTNGNINLAQADKQRHTALDYAIEKGNREIFCELWKRDAQFHVQFAVNVIFKEMISGFSTDHLEIYKYLLSSENFVVTLRAKIGEIKTGLLTIGKSFSPESRLGFLDNTLSNYQDDQVINNLIDQQKLRFCSQFDEMQTLKERLSPNQQIILYNLSPIQKLSLLVKMKELTPIHLNRLEQLILILAGKPESESRKYKLILYQLLPSQRLKLLLLPLPLQLLLLVQLVKFPPAGRKKLLELVSTLSPENLVKFLEKKRRELEQAKRVEKDFRKHHTL